jgi:hypothetical protein
MMATMTLNQWPGLQLAMAVVAAGRAAETVWPSHAEHRLAALVLVTEFTQELLQTHAFLKLDCILAHLGTPICSGSYDVILGASQ